MKDGHPWRWMITKFVLKTAAAVSLSAFVYGAWDQYQNGRTFYPDLFTEGRLLQGNPVIFPGEEQAGSAEGADGGTDFWEKDDHAEEDRLPEAAADVHQMLRAERETMAVAEEENLSEEQDEQPEIQEESFEVELFMPKEPQRLEPAPVILAGSGTGSMENAGDISGKDTVMMQVPGMGRYGDDSDDNSYGGSRDSQNSSADRVDSGSSGNSGNNGNSGSSAGNDGSLDHGAGSGSSGMPEVLDPQPIPPTADFTGEDPDPIPELPVNPDDENNGIVPFPTEGIPDDGAEHEYELSFASLDEDDDRQLYYDQILNEWKLLCAVYAYVEVDGVRRYRLDHYSDCFQINGFPDVAAENFDVAFSFRPNVRSQWQETEWEYPVQSYKLVLENWDGSEMDSVFPEEGEAVNLLKYNNEMLEYEAGDNQDTIFPGWTEQPEGETVGNTYTVAEKGRQVLYPAQMEEVPEGMEVALQTAEIEEEVCYVQTLISCNSYENDEAGTLDIPQGIQRVAAEEEQGIRAMTMKVPECVMDIASGAGIAVDGEYQVDEENLYYSSRDGVLFDREQTVLYQAPLLMESIVVPETVKEIYGAGISNASEIRFLSEEPPMITEGAFGEEELPRVLVPAGAADGYRTAWGEFLGADCVQQLIREESSDILHGKDGVLYQLRDGSEHQVMLWKAPADLEQFTDEHIPDGLTLVEIGEEAFLGCSRLAWIELPDSVEVIRSRAFAESGLKELNLPSSVKTLEMDFLEDTDLEILNINGEKPPKLNYGKEGTEYSFGCEGVRIILNGKEALEEDLLTQQYIDRWRTQVMGYASAEELFWKIYKDEFWNWGLLERDEFQKTVWNMTMESLEEGELRVRALLGLDENEAEVSFSPLWNEIMEEISEDLKIEIPDEEIPDEEIPDEEISDEEETGTDSNADRKEEILDDTEDEGEIGTDSNADREIKREDENA